jgi:hypothetical protein
MLGMVYHHHHRLFPPYTYIHTYTHTHTTTNNYILQTQYACTYITSLKILLIFYILSFYKAVIWDKIIFFQENPLDITRLIRDRSIYIFYTLITLFHLKAWFWNSAWPNGLTWNSANLRLELDWV